MLNLDTHIFLHALAGSLTKKERRLLSEDGEWGISAIVLWEIAKLHQKGRIPYGLEDPRVATAIERVQVWPLTVNVCRNLHALDFTSDPADELIAATSLTHKVPLVTRDARIRASKIIQCL